MRPASDNLDDLRAAIVANLESFTVALLGEPTMRSASEWRFGSRGSLSIEMAGRKRGAWHSHEGGIGGGPFQLIEHARSCMIAEAIRWARAWIGGDHVSAAPRLHHTTKEKPSTVDLAKRIWTESVTAADTLVKTYLATRGLTLPENAPLRFHPACPRGADRLPAMVALMTDPATGEPTGTHRTFLAADGRGKAEGMARGMLGNSGIIRLTADEDVTHGVGIAEGVETALSVMQTFRWRPVWAATSAGGITRLPVLAGIDALTVFADADGAGLTGAQACAARWADAGRDVRILAPPPGEDFNDTARRMAS